MSFGEIFDLTAEVFSNEFFLFIVLDECPLFSTIVGLMQVRVSIQWGVLSILRTGLRLFSRGFLTGNYPVRIVYDMPISI